MTDPIGDDDFDAHGPQGTRVISREDIARMLAEERAAQPPGDQPSLWGLSPPVQGQRFALSGNRMVIGRAAQCQVRVNDPGVSAEHAQITRDGDGWRIANLLSTNGTFVNGTQVRGGVRLKAGDRIRLSNVELAYEAPAAGDTADGAMPTSAGWSMTSPRVLLTAAVLIALAGVGLWLWW